MWVAVTKCSSVAEALHAWQQHHVLSNPGLNYLPPVEALVILLSHLTNEMLWRAIVLKGEQHLFLTSHLAGQQCYFTEFGKSSLFCPWHPYYALWNLLCDVC